MSFTPDYLNPADIQNNWCAGKVNFGTDPATSITSSFLDTLIVYAESEVSRRFNRFYTIPFVSLTTGDYIGLPQTTRACIERLMTLLAVSYVLDVDFAQKSVNISENYRKILLDQYYSTMNSYFKRADTGFFNQTTLPDLKINPLNYTGLTVAPIPLVVDQFPATANMNYALNNITKTYANWWQFLPYGYDNAIVPQGIF